MEDDSSMTVFWASDAEHLGGLAVTHLPMEWICHFDHRRVVRHPSIRIPCSKYPGGWERSLNNLEQHKEMAISSYTVLLKPWKMVPVRESEDLEQAKGCTFSHIVFLNYGCYCSRQKCNRSKSSLGISWEKHPSGPVNSCVSASTSGIHQPQIAGNKEQTSADNHLRLIFSPLNSC